ncbi:uncharacterized protein LOC113782342 [Coffea eugenioides]|uniref:uncharacterized protein LOC113782342 n=1 Tax=Coffea eugenioides TaxID=49369 RepID=UPI000F60562B|nr:uncharacterized protein LOC113782342 [Coffea eugenioides]
MTVMGAWNVRATFVYASNSIDERECLWHDLVQLNVDNNYPWIGFGDFNTVLKMDEKIGELMDGIHQICWKLDRVLVNYGWNMKLGGTEALFLNPSIFDNSSMVITLCKGVSRTSRPFHFFNHWVKHPTFMGTVQYEWATPVIGNPMYILTQKLKRLKNRLKTRSSEVYSNVSARIEDLRNQLAMVQQSLDLLPMDRELQVKESSISQELFKALTIDESALRQRSRGLWLQLGDSNNGYFYRSFQSRRAHNKIFRIKDMLGRMLEDEHDIKQEAISYFQQRFTPPGQPSSTPLEVNPSNVLNDEHVAWLSNDISSNEIKNALFSMNGDKSPGPDGLTACFFQHS